MKLEILFILFLCLNNVFGFTFDYLIHKNNSPKINSCVQRALAEIEQETCLEFNPNNNNLQKNNAILFLESRECGFQESNRTVHLNPDCIQNDNCAQYVHQALARKKHHPSNVYRHLNIKFNCTDKCTILCENGASTNLTNCSCKCVYGFSGTNCEKLRWNDQYTDSSCGFIKASSNGYISLNGIAEKNTFCQWVIKSEDPFDKIELTFEDLDLDWSIDNVGPGQHCGDQLYIYGTGGAVQNPIPCDSEEKSELIGKKVRSSHNYLFIEYQGNRKPSRQHKGPTFRYTILPGPKSKGLNLFTYSEQHTTANSIPSSSTLSLLLLSIMTILPCSLF